MGKMNELDYKKWTERALTCDSAITIINSIRTSEPARRVRSRRSNVTGRFCSKKMGFTIQYESHTIERHFLLELEMDDDVYEMYDQPCEIPLHFISKSGRKTGIRHVADFFVMRATCAGWEECKSEAQLKVLAEEQPNRYKFENGVWRCPPGEEYAAKFGMYYRVRVDTELNPVFTRNVDYLLDYYRTDISVVSEVVRFNIRQFVERNEGIMLQDVKLAFPKHIDIILHMISFKEIYVDIDEYILSHDDRSPVYSSVIVAEIKKPEITFNLPEVVVKEGTELRWDGIPYVVVNYGNTNIVLRRTDNDTLVPITHYELEMFMRDNKIVAEQTEVDPERPSLTADSNALAEAKNRLDLVEQYLKDGSYPSNKISLRTIQRWARAYRQGCAVHGSGLLALIPKKNCRGNADPKLSNEVRNEVIDAIETYLKDKRAMKPIRCYEIVCNVLKQKGLIPPSRPTFYAYIEQQPKYQYVRARLGKRAAYKFQGFFWNLKQKTPRHGDYFLHIVHCDSTELDIEVRCPKTGKSKGRPWLTIMIDAFTRSIVGIYIAMHSPNRVSVMMSIRDCVKRYRRMPAIIVTDNGKEFHSVDYECLLARYNVEKKCRPPAEARFGSVCERFFGVTNTVLIHNLLGNTKAMKDVRQITKTSNPKGLAVWTLDSITKAMEEWVYMVYDKKEHPALGMSPGEARVDSTATHGEREVRFITYNRDFEMMTMPTPKRSQVKADCNRGVSIASIYYWHEKLSLVHGKHVEVRYDPYNAGRAYAYIKNEWVELRSEYYDTFRHYNQWQIAKASKELRGKKDSSLTGKLIAEFLIATCEKEEELTVDRNKALTGSESGLEDVSGDVTKDVSNFVENEPVDEGDDLDLTDAKGEEQVKRQSIKVETAKAVPDLSILRHKLLATRERKVYRALSIGGER